MENKRTAVITFRTTPEVKAELEFRAEKFGWSVSQYVENRLTDDIMNDLDYAEESAGQILELIQNKEIKSITELTKWAIENGQFEELLLSVDLWQKLIDEVNKPATEEVTKK